MMPSRPASAELPRVDWVMLALLPVCGPDAPAHRLFSLRSTQRTSTRSIRAAPRGSGDAGRPPVGTCFSPMDVPHGFDPTLILALNLGGTFVFGLSGGLAAVRAKLDLFGVVVLAGVVALAGGITRDLLIGTPPATFRDWRYLAAAGASGLVCYFARPALERIQRSVLVFDAVGLGLFCVTGATKALDFKVGAVSAILLGAITGIGGGMLRDVLLRDVPTILRHELYAIPALLGAAVLVVAQESGSSNPVYPTLAILLCVVVRLAGLKYGVNVPIAPSERQGDKPRE